MEPIMYLSLSDNSPFLCHYGIPRRSGRYKWGSGDRPYQSMEGQGLSRKEKRQQAKAEKNAIKKAREDAAAEKAKQAYEEERLRVLSSGGRSATAALKYSDTYTTQELASLVSRVRMTKELEKLAAEERITFMKKVDNVMNGIDKATKYADTTMKAFKKVQEMLDMLEGDDRSKSDKKPQNQQKKKGS